jgi:sugar phosphate isomerase/epimerase
MATQRHQVHDPLSTLQIGLCCGMLLDATLPELIETAARHGFRTITARPATLAAALEAGFTERSLRQLLADVGVRVTMVDALSKGLPGVASPEVLDPALRAVLPFDAIEPPDEETCLRSAEALQAPFVNVSLFRGQRVPLEEMAEAIGALCRRAAARGLKIALEFYPESGIPDLDFALAVVQSCGEPNCAITLDVWHLSRSSGTVEDVRRLPPGVIAGIQISDRIAPSPGTPYMPMRGRSLPGEGELALGEIIRAALANSPGLSAEIEVLNQELRGLSSDAIAARTAAALARWRQAL